MKRVIIESPYAGDIDRNLRYLRACMADCLRRGEAPFASHGLYTQPGVLDDDKPDERKLGIEAGFAWRDVAEMTVVYCAASSSAAPPLDRECHCKPCPTCGTPTGWLCGYCDQSLGCSAHRIEIEPHVANGCTATPEERAAVDREYADGCVSPRYLSGAQDGGGPS